MPSFDNRKAQELDSVVEIKEHMNRPGASAMSKESLAMDPHLTMYERSAIQGPISSSEAAQISMPAANIEPTQINSVHSLAPQGTALPQGIMAVFGHVKPLMPENGHAINQSAYQTISNFGQNPFSPVQSNPSNHAFQPQDGGGTLWQLSRGKNPLSQLVDQVVRNIVDLLF